MSTSDKISWVGGMMGLFTGFSVISLIEIFYWLWFKVIFNQKNSVVPQEKPENDTKIDIMMEKYEELQDEIKKCEHLQNEINELRMNMKNKHSEDDKMNAYFDAIFYDVEAQNVKCEVESMN